MGALEKRRFARYEAELNLKISSLFKQDNVQVKDIETPIKVTNLSRSGIAFTANSILPIGFYFNAELKLGDDDAVLYCVVKIVRKEYLVLENTNRYGCEFVGLSPVLGYIFDEFEKEHEICE